MPKPGRKPRADAQRNRERLLDAAKAVFARASGEASLEAIAREADLGIATLYRNFPTREALYEALYSREVDGLCVLARAVSPEADPVASLRGWLDEMIDLVATKKGMVAALAIRAETTSEISSRLSARLAEALDLLLARAARTGALRADISGTDLLHAVVGLCMLRNGPDWRDGAIKMTGVMIDGMQAPAERTRNGSATE